MLIDSGILTIAFGKQYEALCASTMYHTRKFTALPICVITNVPEKDRACGWRYIDNIIFIDSLKKQSQNRDIKLAMNRLTPFENTFYMDCDSLVQRPGVELFIQFLTHNELVFNPLMKFPHNGKICKIYNDCMKKFNVPLPIDIYNGGFIAFKNTPKVADFFDMWREFWKIFAHGREMPPLNCAIKKSGIPHGKFPKGFIAPEAENDNAIIQHNFNNKNTTFCKKFNILKWEEYKPFDGNKNDFSWIKV